MNLQQAEESSKSGLLALVRISAHRYLLTIHFTITSTNAQYYKKIVKVLVVDGCY